MKKIKLLITLGTAFALTFSGVYALPAMADTAVSSEAVQTTEAAALVTATAENVTEVSETSANDTGYTCVYVHDPRINSKAMEDIVVDPDAVYGFSPDPESTRLGDYADYDWSDPVVVENARQQRMAYLADFDEMYDLWNKMSAEGKSTEEIARAVSAKRNEVRLAAYVNDPDGLAKVKKSNLETYGNENGPTADSLYAKYGSWEKVLLKSFSSNSGMDACLGLYDVQYEHNKLAETIAENPTITYTVKAGDYLMKIAEKYYGNDSSYIYIYNANKDKIGSDYTIWVGEELLIP